MLLRAIDVLVEVAFIIGVVLLYGRVAAESGREEEDMKAQWWRRWRVVFVPFWSICGMWFARTCLQIYVLRPWVYTWEELWHDQLVLGKVRANACSLGLALSAELSIALVSSKLDGELQISAFATMLPMIMCTSVAWIAQVRN